MFRARRGFAVRSGLVCGVAVVALLPVPAGATAQARPAAPVSAEDSSDALVPDGFVASSTSWTSPTDGWVLGYKPCDGDDLGCPVLLQTEDGGASWTRRTAPPLALPDTQEQVRVVMFDRRGGNQRDAGFATDGHHLYSTHDDARTWVAVDIGIDGTADIGALDATNRDVYAVIGTGAFDTGRTRLVSSRLRTDRWKAVPGVEIEGNGNGSVSAFRRRAAVALDVTFAANGYWETTDGLAWAAKTPPCASDAVPRIGTVRKARVDVLCSYDPGFGNMVKDVQRSSEGGEFRLIDTAPELGITQGFAAPRPHARVVTAVSTASVIDSHVGRSDAWTMPVLLPDGPPFADLQFVNGREGFALLGGPGASTSQLYTTSDSGQTWTTLPIED